MRSAEEEEVPEEFDRPSVTISLLTPPLLLAPNGAEVGGGRPLAGHSRSVRQKMKERALDKFPDPSSSHIPPAFQFSWGGGIEGSVALFPSPLQQIKVPIRTQSGGSPEIWQKKEGRRRETGADGGGILVAKKVALPQ